MPRPPRPLLPLMHWLLWLLMALLPLRGWAWTQMPWLPTAVGTAVGVMADAQPLQASVQMPPCHLQHASAELNAHAPADHHSDDRPGASSHSGCTLCDVCHTGLAPSLGGQVVWPEWPQCPPGATVPRGLPEGVMTELFRPPRETPSCAM